MVNDIAKRSQVGWRVGEGEGDEKFLRLASVTWYQKGNIWLFRYEAGTWMDERMGETRTFIWGGWKIERKIGDSTIILPNAIISWKQEWKNERILVLVLVLQIEFFRSGWFCFHLRFVNFVLIFCSVLYLVLFGSLFSFLLVFALQLKPQIFENSTKSRQINKKINENVGKISEKNH